MNAQQQREIEQATSRSLPAGKPLDPEAATLRDGWLSLGRAADEECSGFCEDDLLARLQASMPAQTASVELALPRRSRPFWTAVVGTSLALAMLLAVVRTVMTDRDALRNAGEEAVVRAPGDAAPSSALLAAAWHDPLDDEIAEAREQVRSVARQSAGVDVSLAGLSQHLESLSDELTAGSL